MTTDRKLYQAAVAWLRGDRNFNSGMNILLQSGFKPRVVAKLQRVGASAPAAAERLQYLIREFISVFGGEAPEDTDAELHVFKGKESGMAPSASSSKAIMAMAERVEAQDKSIPENIAIVIRRYANAYKNREKAFRSMTALPENNERETMDTRKALSDAIEHYTSDMEELYPLYDRYLNEHHVPTKAELKALDKDQEKKPAEQNASTPVAADITKLKAEKKSLKTKILRAQNMLDFQQETRGNTPNPMPDCPKRVKYENKIKNLTLQLKKVEYAIAQNG